MFKSLLGIAGDAVKIVSAPVEITLDAARIITKPVADIAEDVRDCFKDDKQIKKGGD